MSKQLNVQPAALTTSVANLLNGAFASLSGPVGFTPTQPRIVVKSIRVQNVTEQSGSFAIYKGASGGSVSGTEVLSNVNAQASDQTVSQEIVLEAGDFLTGKASANNQFTVVISAEIDF